MTAPVDEEPLLQVRDLVTEFESGAGARLRHRLIDELQLASNVSSFNLPARDGHAFALVVTLARGHGIAEAVEDTLAIDVFCPVRQDWIDKTDTYFRR